MFEALKDIFQPAAALPACELALRRWKIAYEKQPDGTIIVPGSIDLSGSDFTQLPDFSAVTVRGDFICNFNALVNLAGAPRRVEGDFLCQNGNLMSLTGAPQYVGGHFRCNHNQLTLLGGAPATVGGDFDCGNNQLLSLEGGPGTVGGSYRCGENALPNLLGAPGAIGRSFDCHGNQLTSLEHAPRGIGHDFECDRNNLASLKGAPSEIPGVFSCTQNPLPSLEEAPEKFKLLVCKFGEFSSWQEIPEALAPQMKARLKLAGAAEAALQLERDVHAATVLQNPIKPAKKIRLKNRA